MSWKHLLLFFLLFSILVSSLLYYVVPKILFPLRKDTIPSGAYVIPWMKPSPSFQGIMSMSYWDIDTVMAEALKLNITFRIEVPNGTRVIPSTVYLGHDKDYLYIGGKFHGMYRNPATDATLTLNNYFNILFDVADDGALNFPESGSMFEVWVNPGAYWRTKLVWSYDDLIWGYLWLTGEDYYTPNAQPAFALSHFDALYDNSTGTVIILFSRFLRRAATSEINALQMRSGERWVMGFLLELGYDSWSGELSDFVDGWPQKTYPYLSNNCSWWPKLCIDLTNPPTELDESSNRI